MSDDASATFRGFRHQALYVLSRLLTDAEAVDRTYRPEGSEDLAVYDAQFHLIEAIQVKDHTSDLSLSKLKPAFWRRFYERQREWPESKTKLATFGEVGPELNGAIQGKENERAKLLSKLCVAGSPFNRIDAERMLDGLRGNILRPVASQLLDSVHDAIRGTAVGGEVERATDLLMYWIFEASEQRRAITRQDLLSQLERIGTYLAALRDSSSEWGTNIVPLSVLPQSEEEKMRWTAEYRQGVQAKWEHIVAGADCDRGDRLGEIHRKLNEFPIAIIRGASGQGKSTLGWRYLHDFVADGMRFHVRRVEGRAHASKIANALGDHVRKLKLRAVAYVDVAPSDVGWSDLIAELAAAGLQVLVAVREEDFRRANVALGDFHFGEVLLDRLSRNEAELIFNKLQQTASVSALDFQDAWTRFSTIDGGPLLEFAHLVTQGEMLRSRIKSQVLRLRNDATAGNHGFTQKHLELLALAALANETGARVSLAGLYKAVDLIPVSLPLQLLEAEYLLRLETKEGSVSVGPVHSLRSKAVVDSLFEEMPTAWVDYMHRVLPHILDPDIEPFLLSVFSRRSEYSEDIFSSVLSVNLRSWTHAAGIAASLIWEGVSRYEKRNHERIAGAIAKFDTAWWLACDSFIGSKDDGGSELRDAIQNLAKRSFEKIELTLKSEVFTLFVEWTSRVSPPSGYATSTDWQGAGDIAHWLAHCGGSGEMKAAIEANLPEKFPEDLEIEAIASYVSGRAQFGDASFKDWHEGIEPELRALFLNDTDSEYVADEGGDVIVYFSTPLADIACKHDPKATDWHWQTMKRVRLLAMLFPNRENYGSQGLGLSALQLGHDPTFKRIPAKSMQSERATHINAVFLAIVAYRHLRATSWKEYSDAALRYRQSVCECFRKLHRAWSALLSVNSPSATTFEELPGAEMDALVKLGKLPMFPRCAVDEWGFVSENRSESPDVKSQRLAELLQRFGKWRKSFSDFETGVERVLSGVMPTMFVFAAEHKNYQATVDDENAIRLLLINLAAAWEALPRMQTEFERQFGHFYSKNALAELNKHERSNFRHLWPAAFAMHTERHVRIPDFGRSKEREVSQMQIEFLRRVKEEIEETLGERRVSLGDTPWLVDDEAHLRIVCDHASLESLNKNAGNVVHRIWKACRCKQWRNMEWEPLIIAWPKLAIVHVLKGKAFMPACVRLNTFVLCATEDAFEAQPHHLMASSVSSEEFAASGIQIWDNPLIERIFALQGAVLAFCATVPRFFEMFNMAREHDLRESEIERILPRYAKELNLVWQAAQSELELTENALSICSLVQASIWREQLRTVCENLLFAVSPSKSLSLEPDDFFAWNASFEEHSSSLQSLVSDILTVVLE